MGMFDSFYLTGQWADAIRCANGHRMVYELQTKQLECVLARVVVNDDGSVAFDSALQPVDVDYLALNGNVETYGCCPECRPLYSSTSTKGHYNHSHPELEVRLSFENGKLVATTKTSEKSIEDVRREMKAANLVARRVLDEATAVDYEVPKLRFFDELPPDAEAGECTCLR